MYYPYLRGKQYEYLALRAISKEFAPAQRANIRPVIEPVKRAEGNDAATVSALSAMLECGVLFAYILNPQEGDFVKGHEIYFPDAVRDVLTGKGTWIPAFLLKGDAGWLEKEAERLIDTYQLSNLLVVLPKNEDVSKWNGMLARSEVETIVCCDADSRPTLRRIRQFGKAVVRLDDCFQTEQRNKDFRGKEDQRFNDNVAYYQQEHFAGFGDYTTLPGIYVKGGMLPWVVAIHMTYNKNEEEVWIHHFLSETNDNGTENIQGKFREAAEQVRTFFEQSHPDDMTPAVDKLHRYVLDGHYPGLGILKKLSIEHHITLMCRR